MSFATLKNVIISYTPLQGRFSSDSDSDPEKEHRVPLHRGSDSDVEAGYSEDGHGHDDALNECKKQSSGRIIDGRTVSDAIIGLSDGMTVPFALTAGLSALGDTKVVVFGGLAELIAGAISMGLGGYLGAKSEEESYYATLKETQRETITNPASTTDTVSEIFAPYDLPPELVSALTTHLSTSPKLPSFLMNFHHTLPEPSDSRAVVCALTIALGYFLGGFVPLVPYFFVGPLDAFLALQWSIATMVVALFVFGYSKTCFVSGWKGSRNCKRGLVGGLQMVLVGGIAAGSAMGLVKGFSMLASSSAEE